MAVSFMAGKTSKNGDSPLLTGKGYFNAKQW